MVRIWAKFAFFLSVFFAFINLNAQQLVPPILTISDGQGNSVTVDSTGNAICTGTCTPNGGMAYPGVVGWTGQLGNFNIYGGIAGVSKPADPPSEIDIQTGGIQAGSQAGTLTVQFTDTGFTGINSTATMSEAPTMSAGTIQYASYVDNTNTPFGKGTLVAQFTANSANLSGAQMGQGPTAEPFSMTSVEKFNLPAGAQVVSDDYNLIIPPAPLTLSCPLASGEVGQPYNSSLMAHGGVPPYSFSIISGSLPPGLMLNANGTITGTPQTPGTFNFVGQVSDTQGTKATTPIQNGCSIIVTPAPSPLTLACPASTGLVGLPYNSSLVATGGVKPYMFSIAAGSLPNGLTLNPMSGAITGTPTSEGPFTITAKVTDSSGSSASNSKTQQCTITVTTCGTSLTSIKYNVNENNTNGEIAWFNSHLTQLSGTIPTSTFQVFITGGKITFGPNTLSVPDAVITFSPTANCASTSFNTAFNRWETTVPLSYASKADEIFAAGLAYLIPSGFPQNVNNVNWSADVSSSAPGVSVSWQFGVSNWLTSHNGTTFPGVSGSSFTPDYNGMDVNPAHNVPLCNTSYNAGDHAGAPEFPGRGNVLTGGGSGGGGSNWTGSWSSTPCPVRVCKPSGPLPLGLTCPASSGTVNQPYNSALVASGGTMPYTFSLASGTLSDGLSLNTATGVISGTPTAPTTLTFVGQVTDSSNPQMTATTPGSACTITVQNTPPAPVCHGANSSLINSLGQAGPSNFAVLSLGGSNALVNINLATVNGNVGVPNTGSFQESAPSVVTGDIIVGSQVSQSGAKGAHGPFVVNDTLLGEAVVDAVQAAMGFALLPATPSVQAQFPSNGQISGPLTINLLPGVRNVVNLSNFELNNGSNTLTFNGPAGTSLVINDSGNFDMHTGNIAVTGGMGPLDVVYNITNPFASVTTMVPTTGVGILLAPGNAITSMDSSSFTGEVIGGFNKSIVLMSGTKVTNPCQP
jgi:hypothetical protein